MHCLVCAGFGPSDLLWSFHMTTGPPSSDYMHVSMIHTTHSVKCIYRALGIFTFIVSKSCMRRLVVESYGWLACTQVIIVRVLGIRSTAEKKKQWMCVAAMYASIHPSIHPSTRHHNATTRKGQLLPLHLHNIAAIHVLCDIVPLLYVTVVERGRPFVSVGVRGIRNIDHCS